MAAKAGPLGLDAVGQRQLAATSMVALQAAKAYAYVMQEHVEALQLGRLVFWSMLDMALVLAIAAARIPRWRVSPARALVFIAVLVLVNERLFGGNPLTKMLPKMTMTFGAPQPQQNLTLQGPPHVGGQAWPAAAPAGSIVTPPTQPSELLEVPIDDPFQMGERLPRHMLPEIPLLFQGLVELHVLRIAKARFRSPPVISLGAMIPLQFDGEAPWTLQYITAPLPPKHLRHPHFPTVRATTTRTVVVGEKDTWAIAPERTGVYTLVALRDGFGRGGLVGNDSITVVIGPHTLPERVPRPPSARFVAKDLQHACAGTPFVANVRISGTPPFQVVFERQYNHTSSTRIPVTVDVDKRLHGKTYQVPLGTIESEGSFSWRIVSVSNAQTSGSSGEGVFSEPNKKARSLLAEAHARPIVSFGVEHAVLVSDSPLEIGLSLSGNAPFVVNISGFTQEVQLPTALQRLAIGQTGNYELLAVRDAYCTGVVVEPSVLHVERPAKPTLVIDTKSLSTPSSVCLGGGVVNIRLHATGKGPWTALYREAATGVSAPASSLHQLTLPTAQYDWTVVPYVAGTRVYEFVAISDAYYKDVPLYDTAYTLHVRTPPRATFVDAQPLYMCSDVSVAHVHVAMLGQPPFSLSYSLQLGNEKRAFLLENVETKETAINVDHLSVAGHYRLTLNRVRDVNGCDSVLDQEKTLVVERLTASLACGEAKGVSTAVMRTGDDSHLQVRLHGGVAPFVLRYRTPQAQTAQTLNSPSAAISIPITGSGPYQLISIRDAHCEGQIEDVKECIISVVERPTVTLRVDPDTSLCFAPRLRIGTLNFTGSAPWTLKYRVDDLDSRDKTAQSSSLQLESNSAVNHSFYLAAPRPGRYAVRLLELSDAHYHHVKLDHLDRYATTLEALPTATATFTEAAQVDQTLCVGQVLRLPVTLHGTPPFVVHYTLASEHAMVAGTSRFEEDKAKSSGFFGSASKTVTWQRVLEIGPIETEGAFRVTLNDVTDALLCVHRLTNLHSGVVTVGLPPSVTSLTPVGGRCVGDRIKFELGPANGGPWTLRYLFNGEERSHVVSHTPFSFSTRTEGIMNVHHVENRFCSSPASIVHEIHALPNALLDNGKEVVEYISEGQTATLNLTLIGSPPFNVTLLHTSFFADEPEKLEIHGVHTNRYAFTTNQEGEYRIIYVSDRHCVSLHDPTLYTTTSPPPDAAMEQ